VISQQIPSSGSTDLWLYDLARNTPVRFTSDVQVDNWPAWWPDGRSLVYSRNVEGAPHLVRSRLSDVAIPQPILPPTGQIQYDADVAPDGRAIAYGQSGDIWLWRMGGVQPRPLVQTPFAEGSPAFSPDGAWLAYDSNVSGRSEVYVRPFARAGDVVRVSTAGGSAPRWRRDGHELFFLDAEGRITAARVSAEPAFVARPPETVGIRSGPIDAFDVSRDGQRFVAVLRTDREPSRLTVILNWQPGPSADPED
jgi:Tol biopolymer transport system component